MGGMGRLLGRLPVSRNDSFLCPSTISRLRQNRRLLQYSKVLCSSTNASNEIKRKPPHPNESFVSGASANYLDQMYEVYKQDPKNVNPSLRVYFENVDSGKDSASAFQPFPGLCGSTTSAPHQAAKGSSEIGNIVSMVRAYQTRGHEMAKLDPLGIVEPKNVDELDYRTFGFTDADLDRQFELSEDVYSKYTGILSQPKFTLRSLVNTLQQSYCKSIGVEYMHINDSGKQNFIRSRFEKPDAVSSGLSNEEKLQVLERLAFAVLFERFLATKWNTAKRFGLEGCDSFIPGFKSLIDRGTLLGVQNVVIGMPHRGRLNVIANVVRKDLYKIFMQFKGHNVDTDSVFKSLETTYAISGDVKYHLGMTYARKYPDGREVELSLAANPSHLEAVDPVVIGKTRAKQYYMGDENGIKSMPVLIHGDAAFCGQGVVFETLGMSQLPDYKTGGTVHVVVNNQIGFTTDPTCSRSTRYCTDIGKAFDCPVFHVNADDPEAVVYVFKAAAEYRQKYLTDVFIDIVGYRRNGHNEMDQPLFTQPEMYQKIKNTPNVFEKYSEECINSGLCDKAHVEKLKESIVGLFEREFVRSTHPESLALGESGDLDFEWVDSKWTGEKAVGAFSPRQPTRVDESVLKSIGEVIFSPPKDFSPHRTLKGLVKQKLDMCESGEGLDWGCAELLAYGSLLLEGKHVRIAGQDSQRGTFSHRHAILHDQKTFEKWCGLNNLEGRVPPISVSPDRIPKIARITAANSLLSEYGAMGFELGYALEDPNALVIWEAQFGDFCNAAQIIIDQFLSCGETKWSRQCGLTLFLPHGYDGGGPEHSSCRLERFLQLSDEDPDEIPENIGSAQSMAIQNNNWQVVNLTTPAQLFHVLRRQVLRGFRKPLIVATPKSMLKDDLVKSRMEDLSGEHASFHRMLSEVDPRVNATPDEKIRKVIFTVGKIYYELATERENQEKFDIAIVRIEQITPFPYDRVQQIYLKYPNAEFVFCQEEPKNMGAWYFCDDRIYTAIRQVKQARGEPVDEQAEVRAKFIGRPTMASPAVGYGSVNAKQQEQIISRALA